MSTAVLDLWDELVKPQYEAARLTGHQLLVFGMASFLHAWSMVRHGDGRGWRQRDRQVLEDGIVAIIHAIEKRAPAPQPIADAVGETYPDQDDPRIDMLLTDVVHILNCLFYALDHPGDRRMQGYDAASSACIAVARVESERYRKVHPGRRVFAQEVLDSSVLAQAEFAYQAQLLDRLVAGEEIALSIN